MKIPTTIKIGPKYYKVRERNYPFNEGVGGQINYQLNTIDVRKDVSIRDKENSFFHEVSHGMIRELSFNHPKIVPFRGNEDFIEEMGLMMRNIFLQLINEQKGGKIR